MQIGGARVDVAGAADELMRQTHDRVVERAGKKHGPVHWDPVVGEQACVAALERIKVQVPGALGALGTPTAIASEDQMRAMWAEAGPFALLVVATCEVYR